MKEIMKKAIVALRETAERNNVTIADFDQLDDEHKFVLGNHLAVTCVPSLPPIYPIPSCQSFSHSLILRSILC